MDCRWQVVGFLLRDIARAVDCSPGLAATLRDLPEIVSAFTEKRRRVKQTSRIRTFLS